jgi:glycosyltransferase involved in cell wall biosynthesis
VNAIGPEISVVIPARNEADVLSVCIAQTAATLAEVVEHFEIVVVDDGSTDSTWTVLCVLQETYPAVRGIRFTRNFGKEAAVFAGLRSARGRGVVLMDSDLQHPPALLPEMIDRWDRGGVAVVEAVKEKRQLESGFRRWGARLFYRTFKMTAGLDLRGATDFKLLDRRVVDEFLALPERSRFFRGLTAWLGHDSEKISFIPPDRPGEKPRSRWSPGRLLTFARHSLIAFTASPMQVVTWLGIITFVFSLLLGAQTLFNKLTGRAVEGFTTVILVQLAVGSILMVSLGVIGEYLARIYEEVKGRPLYVIETILPAPKARAANEPPNGPAENAGRRHRPEGFSS